MEWTKADKDHWECPIADSVIVLVVVRRKVARKWEYKAGALTFGWKVWNATPYSTLEEAQTRAVSTGKRLLVEAFNALMAVDHALAD